MEAKLRHHTFSQDYSEARQYFVDSARKAGAVCLEFPLEHAAGPNGEALFIDAARFGPADAKSVLLCVSGTHGAEGFPGSAVQIDWVEREGRFTATSQEEIAVWMVHAVNPFGFAWQMRCNENNVDLNRNWVAFENGRPENPDFDELAPMLAGFTDDKDAQSVVTRTLSECAAERGKAWLENALTQGQYDHPHLMSYGGQAPQASRDIITALVTGHMQAAQRVAYVDFHSGTQGIGELIFLCFSPPRSEAFARASDWWGKENLDPEKVEEKWGGARPNRHGLMYWGLEEVFGPDVGFAGAVVEFGTLDPAQRGRPILAALTENRLRKSKSHNAPGVQKDIELLRWSFDRPGDTVWEKAVIEKGRWVLRRALDGLAGWHSEGRSE